MNQVLQLMQGATEPMTAVQISEALGKRNCAGEVSRLLSAGRLRIAGRRGRSMLYLPAAIGAARDEGRAGEAVSDTTFESTPLAIRPAPSGRVWLETSLALKLISLALSKPAALSDEERLLLADAIHATSDQLP